MSLSTKFRRTTLVGSIRFILLRSSSIIYLMIISRWLTQTDLGLIAFLGIGVSLIPKSVIHWLGWVMQQRSLTSANEIYSKKVITEISIYMLFFGFTFGPIFAIFYLYLLNIPFLSTIGLLFIIIVLLDTLVQLFSNVEVSNLNIEFRLLVILAQALLNYILAIILYYLFNSIVYILIGWVITEIIICIVYIYRNWSVFRDFSVILGVPSILKLGIPVFVLNLFRSLSTSIDRIVIGAFIDQETLATYHLAYRVADIFVEGILAFTIALFPLLMKLESINTDKSNIVFLSMFKIVFMIIVSIFPFLILFPHYVLELLFSEKYLSGVTILSILAISSIMDIVSNLNLQFKGVKGNTDIMLKYAFCYFFTQTGVFIVLFRLGVMGIAYSRLIGSVISMIYTFISSTWTKNIPTNFYIKTLFHIFMMFVSLMILNQYFHLLITLTLSTLILILVSSLLSYFTQSELDIIKKGVPAEIRPIFGFYQWFGYIFRNKKKKR